MPYDLGRSQEDNMLMFVKGYYAYHPEAPAHLDHNTGYIYVGSDYAAKIVMDQLVLDRNTAGKPFERIDISEFKSLHPEEENPLPSEN